MSPPTIGVPRTNNWQSKGRGREGLGWDLTIPALHTNLNIRSLVGARPRTDCLAVRPGGGPRIRVPSLVYDGDVTFRVRPLYLHPRGSQRVLL